MNLAHRARKATGLDIEDFADLLGVHFHEVEGWEDGSKQLDTMALNLFRLVAAQPRECVQALRQAKQQRGRLSERIVAAMREHGHGPKRTITLKRLRELASVERTEVGLAQLAQPEEVSAALLDMEAKHQIRLEAPVEPSALGPLEREASIHDPKRGLLAYATPGPRFPRS
jgi:transcriptional regulator with XRE-family HTH domain